MNPLMGHYNPSLVLLSVLVASLASYTTLNVAARAENRTRHPFTLPLLFSALVMGLGIWAMHFIGMLAHSLPIAVQYDPALVVVSAAAGIFGAVLALWTVRGPTVTPRTLVQGGLLLGLGMAGMHYLGMAGMRLSGHLTYTPLSVVLSLLIAISAATVALKLAQHFVTDAHQRWRVLAALVLGVAIAGMHYTAMSGTTVHVIGTQLSGGSQLAQTQSQALLARNVALVSSLLMVLALGTLVIERRLALQRAATLESQRQNRELELRVAQRTAELVAQRDALYQAKEELRRSNAELERFAYVASHDLQAPLRSVVSFAELLERRYQDQLDERGRLYLHQIHAGGQHMKQLVDDLLTFSQVGHGRQTPMPVDTNALIKHVLYRLQLDLDALNAQVSCGPLPTVLGHNTPLDQLFSNLIGNAIKYQRPGLAPHVEVGAECSGTDWEFYVRDNGIGIEEQYFERIFEVFQRLHSKTEYAGTGIGLALCRKIVDSYGGRLWVSSTPGQGSTFHFTLPGVDRALTALPESAAATTTSADSSVPELAGRPLKITSS
ncbi:sensor histidine kinase [Deinococcus aquatilis]|uniref:sensor histidine kinase n=1 Tax=Deinococcus aquatilis TaxID=519440 RepID=UPI0003638900|nr:MHYT domain-containing protein [Deinococcus aquatilis]